MEAREKRREMSGDAELLSGSAIASAEKRWRENAHEREKNRETH
jgi:hypothetical protein